MKIATETATPARAQRINYFFHNIGLHSKKTEVSRKVFALSGFFHYMQLSCLFRNLFGNED